MVVVLLSFVFRCCLNFRLLVVLFESS